MLNSEKVQCQNYITTLHNIKIIISSNSYIGNISLDHYLDQQPTIQELLEHARTAKWNQLGVILELDKVDLENCHDYTSMYQLWIEEKDKNATRRNLLDALKVIRQSNVARKYKDYLKTTVSYIVHISIYTCT